MRITFALLGLLALAATPREEKPHIIFIMADDMGWGDARCFNPESKIPTPNIDRLAKEGMKFTDAHSPGSTCITTRYGLLTGRYPLRMKARKGTPLIAADRTTIASLLKSRGYATAMVGKWHLGVEGEKNPKKEVPLKGGPVDRGFDDYFGIPASLDIPPYYYIEGDRCVEPPSNQIEAMSTPGWTRIQGEFWRAGGIAPGYIHHEVLPTFTRKAVGMIHTHATSSSKKPLFLYLALGAPHTPWLPAKDLRGKSGASMYGEFVANVDRTVGAVLNALDAHKMTDNTLIFFTSDNGPVWYPADVEKYGHSSTGLFRGMKGDAWEGGHRMPFLARWPGRIKPGSTSAETICHTDMLATFAEVAGAKVPAETDSISILPALLGQKREGPLRQTIIHHYPMSEAIREGPWKLIPHLGSGGFSKPRRIKPVKGGPRGQLYNLADDPSETKNLWSEKPDVVRRLTALLERLRRAD